MITRVVKMTFQKGKVDEFLEIFDSSKHLIRNMPGCSHLELLQDKDNHNVFFTYSKWENENDLNNYRGSEVFEKVWGKTKMLFAEKPQAWSTNARAEL